MLFTKVILPLFLRYSETNFMAFDSEFEVLDIMSLGLEIVPQEWLHLAGRCDSLFGIVLERW